MSDQATQSLQNSGAEVAEQVYEQSDYRASDTASAGIAETHEQYSDAYKEGTIDNAKEEDSTVSS